METPQVWYRVMSDDWTQRCSKYPVEMCICTTPTHLVYLRRKGTQDLWCPYYCLIWSIYYKQIVLWNIAHSCSSFLGWRGVSDWLIFQLPTLAHSYLRRGFRFCMILEGSDHHLTPSKIDTNLALPCLMMLVTSEASSACTSPVGLFLGLPHHPKCHKATEVRAFAQHTCFDYSIRSSNQSRCQKQIMWVKRSLSFEFTSTVN